MGKNKFEYGDVVRVGYTVCSIIEYDKKDKAWLAGEYVTLEGGTRVKRSGLCLTDDPVLLRSRDKILDHLVEGDYVFDLGTNQCHKITDRVDSDLLFPHGAQDYVCSTADGKTVVVPVYMAAYPSLRDMAYCKKRNLQLEIESLKKEIERIDSIIINEE